MTTITNMAGFISWASGGGTSSSASEVIFSTDGTYTIDSSNNSSFPVNIGNTTTGATKQITGQYVTITVNNVAFSGLINPVTSSKQITIGGLTINLIGSSTLSSACGTIITNTNGTRDNYIISIDTCAVEGSFDVPTDGGGLVGYSGDSTCTIISCYSNCTISGLRSGGIAGTRAGSRKTVSISNCYSTGAITGSGAGGIVGSSFGFSSTSAIVSDCYSTGTISGQSAGGICGSSCGEFPTNVDIQNCYSVGNIGTAGNTSYTTAAGGIIGSHAYTLTCYNCYTTGTIVAGGGIVGGVYLFETMDITNCHSKNATTTGTGTGKFVSEIGTGGTVNVTSSDAGGGTWSGTSLTDISTVWNTTQSPYMLKVFKTSPWNGDTYSSYNDSTVYFGSGGDPHVTPIFGPAYDIHYVGLIKWFDNNCQQNRFTIIGSIENGINDYRSTDMTYIRKLYVEHDYKKMIIDAGFRGQPAKIIKNDGFCVKNTILSFQKNIKRKCSNPTCNFKTRNNTDNIHTYDGHYVPNLLRNMLEFNVSIPNDNIYTIKITNVDEYNSHPCHISIKFSETNIHKLKQYAGIIVREDANNIIDDTLKEQYLCKFT